MKRKIYLAFTDVVQHIDLSFLDDKQTSTKLFIKGQPRSNGKTIQKMDSVNIHLNNEELPDDYDLRIAAMINAVGGEEVVEDLVSTYQARISAIVLGIPTRTGDSIEDSYISCEMMKKLYNLKLELHFHYT